MEWIWYLAYILNIAYMCAIFKAIEIFRKSEKIKITILAEYIIILYPVLNIFFISFLINDANKDIIFSLLTISVAFISIFAISFKFIFEKEFMHTCVSVIITTILLFSNVYQSIEMIYPDSFSSIEQNNKLIQSIDFIYFSTTTFTTVGFGDITPQTTLARAVVTLEIITAFAMLVLAVNFFVVKKDNDKMKEEKDEKELR